MAWSLDARIPVVLWTDPAPPPAADGTVTLAEAGQGEASAWFDSAAAHVAGCACCSGRSDAALALDRLFQARARGTLPWFRRVVAVVPSAAGQAAVSAALAGDALTVSRYRRG
jgi:hypothetical protein